MPQAHYNILETVLTRPVAFHRIFADIAGGIAEGIFLSQLYYWMPRGKEDWIYKSFQEWEKELGITRREYEKARKTLKAKGLLQEQRRGLNPVLWFKLDIEKLYQAIADLSHPKPPEPIVPDVQNISTDVISNTPNVQSDISKGNLWHWIYIQRLLSEITNNLIKADLPFENGIPNTPVSPLPETQDLGKHPDTCASKESETIPSVNNTNVRAESVYAPPCSMNDSNASHKTGDKYFNNGRRQAFREKQKSGEFRDKPQGEKIGVVYAQQAELWGKSYQEIKEGFEGFVMAYAKQKDKPTPERYVGFICHQVFDNPEEAAKSYLWQEYLKTYKRPQTEPDEGNYLSCATVFKHYARNNLDYVKEFISDSVKHLGWTFADWVNYAHSKGHFLKFSL